MKPEVSESRYAAARRQCNAPTLYIPSQTIAKPHFLTVQHMFPSCKA
jgi:hypothetical protein